MRYLLQKWVKNMTNKLKFLTSMSLGRKINTKWFKIVNVVLLIIVIGLINIDSVITFFGGDFSNKVNMVIIDETNAAYHDFTSIMQNTVEEGKEEYNISLWEEGFDDAVNSIKKNELLIHIINDEDNIFRVKIISHEQIDTLTYQIVINSLNTAKSKMAISMLNINDEDLNKLYAPAIIEREFINGSGTSTDEMMTLMMSTIFPIIILPFFMLIIFLVQMIGAEVNDEKTTKGMEIIISNVSPKTHFFSKIIAGNVFVFFQGFLLVFYGAIGLLLRRVIIGKSIVDGLGIDINNMIDTLRETGILGDLNMIIPLALILLALSFVAYSLVAGILASMTTNTEDFQQVQMPIMIILLIGYYFSIMAGMFKGAFFIKLLSYVPFISALLAPSLLMMGQINIIDVVISIIVLGLTNYLLIHYGLKIYKTGILNYSSSKIWSKMWNALTGKSGI